ncbi:MAG: protein translocase subunit SecD [Actinobacteria bacterium]|nr:protein translocase subunit SecD [Actinomycetota bacterium]MCL6088489.1 protein translocase subunit SecD [Actinomycetota bacterium]
MRQNRLNIAVIIIFIIITGLAVWSILTSPVKLGLDLKGGTQVILKATQLQTKESTSETKTGGSVSGDAIDKAMLIMLNRIDKLGISEPLVTKDFSNNIVVQLPGVDNPDRAVEVIGKTAQLEFKIVEGFDDNGNYKLGPTLITGDKLSNAKAGYDNNGQVIVQFSFNSEGAKQFEKVTSENIGKQLAIVLDGEVKSAPVIRSVISDNGVIENIGSLEEAKDIALVLQTGALPVNLEIQEVRTIGPTLGQDSLQQSMIAGVIGIILVALFMIIVFRGLGLVSLIGLFCYIALFWGIISALKTPLTLPGIAGIILTIGIAVDANVLIFARIKEEMLKGKTKIASFREGFKNALKAIIDSNITTLITAAALYRFGTGPIRGFAVTLAIGIIISMFTAIILIRAILFLAVNSRVMTPGFIGIRKSEIKKVQ